MLPYPSLYYIAYQRACDIILVCKGFIRVAILGQEANCNDVFFCQFCGMMLLASMPCFGMDLGSMLVSFCLAILLHTVFHIFYRRCQPQVQRVCAWRAITMMCHKYRCGYRLRIPYLIHNTCYDTFNRFFQCIAQYNKAIAILIVSFCPWPATIRAFNAMTTLANVSPQAIKKWWCSYSAIRPTFLLFQRILTCTTPALLTIRCRSVVIELIQDFVGMTIWAMFHRGKSFIKGLSERNEWLEGDKAPRAEDPLPLNRV